MVGSEMTRKQIERKRGGVDGNEQKRKETIS